MSTSLRRKRTELLVSGYIREENSNHTSDIPLDIIDLCVLWYHIESFLMKAGDYCTINDAGNSVEYKNDNEEMRPNSCYGSMEMPSVSKSDIAYIFKLKVIKLGRGDIIGIGIDDAEFKWSNDNFTLAGRYAKEDKTYHSYGYISNCGSLYTSMNSYGRTEYGDIYKTGDVITVIYNPFASTLRFDINGKKQKEIKDVYGKYGVSYRLCIYMGYSGNQIVELLE